MDSNNQFNSDEALTIVSGPNRSGKSRWAEYLIKSKREVTYFATSCLYPDDSDWQKRISMHKKRRPRHWKIIETSTLFFEEFLKLSESETVLIDSLGGFVTYNLPLSNTKWIEIEEQFINNITEHKGQIIVVVEEIGWGLVPVTHEANLFRDRLGNLSQLLQKYSEDSWLVLHGRAINISSNSILVP